MITLTAANAVTIHHPTLQAALPLLVDSPHSGRMYPADFITACTPQQLRGAEDFHVDELLTLLPDIGATVVCANYPRTYIDVNRALTDLDQSMLYESWPWLTKPTPYTQAGIGLIHREVKPGHAIYRERLSVAVVQQRIRNAYMPYHETLANQRATLLGRFGQCLLLNVHSMPSASAPKNAQGKAYDVVLGDRDGQTAASDYTNYLAQLMTQAGLAVGVNKNYKGGEIVRRHGVLRENAHAIQIEFNRALYMDEFSMTLNNAGVVRLQKALRDTALKLVASVQDDQKLAAE
ncbi:MAG: N-formylglutamate amidohydrolase [Bdellovibrionales bacterium]